MKWIGRSLLAFFLAATSAQAAPRAVWIDTDLSLGSPLREVDDGYALLLALRSPELRIAGVSTSYGNAPLRGTTARTQNSLGAFGAQITVAPGAAAANDLGRETAATRALAIALRREPLTYLALGPLTNLASFLQLHPELADRITRVVMLAGRTPGATLGFGPGHRFQIHDANLHKDPAAVRAVLRADRPILLVPIETAGRLTLQAKDARALAQSDSAGRYLAQRSGAWLWFWTKHMQASGAPIFDALAVVAVAQPALVDTVARRAAFDDQDRLLVRPDRGRKVDYCRDFAPETKALILRRLTGRSD